MATQSSICDQDIASWVSKINQDTVEKWWVGKTGSSLTDHDKQAHRLAVHHIERLLRGAASPEQAAQEFAKRVEPLILAGHTHNMSCIFSVIVHAIRALGQNPDLCLPLHDFLEALSHIEVTDKQGKPIYDVYGLGNMWTDVSYWWMEFDEGALDMKDIQHSMSAPCYGALAPDEWLAQRPALLGAYTFVAMCTAYRPRSGYEGYVLTVLEVLETLDEPYQHPDDPRYELLMYIPMCALLMDLAAHRIFELCIEEKDTAFGPFSLGKWETWGCGFEQIAASEDAPEDAREEARKAVVDMNMAEREWQAAHKNIVESGWFTS